jgi:putative endonuclease
MKYYYVYIMANEKPSLYIGVTNDLARRVMEHKTADTTGFTNQYRVRKLVYYEIIDSAEVAISREKQLKNWHREWKMNLVKAINPSFVDLYSELIETAGPETSSG